MHLIAVHKISDPERFFSAAQTTPIPEGITLHSMLPSRDRSRAVCVWEADSQDEVKTLVEDTVGDSSENEYFELDAQNAQGLPG